MLIKHDDKILIYTAVIGDYDKEILSSTFKDLNTDMLLITDNPNVISSDRKRTIINNDTTLDNARLSRFFKIYPYSYTKEYKYALWIDGHVSIKKSIRELINNNILESNFSGLAFINHPCRDCIYTEAEFCKSNKKDYPHIIDKQIAGYKKLNYPEHNGLIRGTIIFRDLTNNKVKLLMHQWYKEVLRGSRRDQISFNFAAWQYNFTYNNLNKNLYKEYFTQHKHHNNTI